jgi:hypothetical protein
LDWAHYGERGSRGIIAVEAMKLGVDPHLFDSRSSALAHLKMPHSRPRT